MKPLPEPAWTDVPRVDATDADELPGVNCIARTPDARSLPQHRDWAQAARDAMSRYGNGGTYVNFTGEGSADVTHKSYPPETYAQLHTSRTGTTLTTCSGSTRTCTRRRNERIQHAGHIFATEPVQQNAVAEMSWREGIRHDTRSRLVVEP